ncbi:MAG TPA: vanadium-dependent haloperoxidase [Vicinamibacterales bacterium]|nr:vanadium-dependent haloperoxidase [Vicinamibacterales bacterium]
MTDRHRAWIRMGILVCCVCAPVLLRAAPRDAALDTSDGNVITEWNAIAQYAIITVAKQPIQRSQLWMTLVHVAIYDAVSSITGEYEQFKVTPAQLRPASRDAAAIAAAHGVLVRLLPDQQATFDAARARSLAAIRDGVKKDNGIAIGEEVASRLLEIHDGVIPTVTYTVGTGPGVWQPTPPNLVPALLPGFAQVTPFALVSASQFRPGPPPSLTSSLWARDYNEVKVFGVKDGSLRTDEQTEIGRFYTEHAVAQYSRAFRGYATENSLDLQQSARFFAMVNTAILDSQIACWDAKFHYNFWRPVTAIQAGDTDDNPATDPDPAWMALAATPAHPEYPAAHGCWTSATATILEHFNATNAVHFVLDSAVTGTTHVFENTNDLRSEIINARVYGGMHFRNSVEVGARIGQQVADWVAYFFFQPKPAEIDPNE